MYMCVCVCIRLVKSCCVHCLGRAAALKSLTLDYVRWLPASGAPLCTHVPSFAEQFINLYLNPPLGSFNVPTELREAFHDSESLR